jgi:hypothetical protein
MEVKGVREIGDRGGAIGISEADQQRSGTINRANGSVIGAWRDGATDMVKALIRTLGRAASRLFTTH